MAFLVGINHLGAFISMKNGTPLPSSVSKSSMSVRAVSIFEKPVLGIHFNCVLAKESYGFEKRRMECRVRASSVVKGEISVIEKELSFSASFSDYVKIMESVKVDRSSNSRGDSENQSSNKNIRSKVSSFSSDSKVNKKIANWKKEPIKENYRENPKDFTKFGNMRNSGSFERNGRIGEVDKFGHSNFDRKNESENDSHADRRSNNRQYERGQFDRSIEQKNTPKDRFIDKSEGFRKEKFESGYEFNQIGERKSYQQNRNGRFDQSEQSIKPKDRYSEKSESFRREKHENEYEINQIGETNSYQKNRNGRFNQSIEQKSTPKDRFMNKSEGFRKDKRENVYERTQIGERKSYQQNRNGRFDQSIEPKNAPKDGFVDKSEHFRKDKRENGYEINQIRERKSYQQNRNGQFDQSIEHKNTPKDGYIDKSESFRREKRENGYGMNQIGEKNIYQKNRNVNPTHDDTKFERFTPKDRSIDKSEAFRRDKYENGYKINQTGENKSYQKNRYVSPTHDDTKFERFAPKDRFIDKSESFRRDKYENGYKINQIGENKSYQKNRYVSPTHDDTKFERFTPKDRFIDKSESFRRDKYENGYKINQIGENKSYQKNTNGRFDQLIEQNNTPKDRNFGKSEYYNHNDTRFGGNKIIRRGESTSTDLDEHAAFKTFEVFTDVNNRPRVLKMEMEERIQQLACQLNAANVNMPAWQFSKIMHGAKIKFSDHSILRVVQFLGKLGNWRQVLQIVQWLRTGERFNSYKTRYIYTSVLDVLGKARRPFEALNVFNSMREEFGSYPDLASYHCIAVALGQAGLMKELFDVMECMRNFPRNKNEYNTGHIHNWDPRLEPDLVVYNAVLNACVQAKQWQGAFWVLQQLKERFIRPSNTTYGLVMEVMLVCEKYNLVYEFFDKMKKSQMPSALNYKMLINAFWKEGKTEEAIEAVKEMERKGIVGSASLYYDFARCLCTAGRCEEALLQIDKICKVAKKPLVVTYTGLIQACIDSDNLKNAKYIFEKMQKFCSPNVITYNIMLKLYIRHEMFDESISLFNEILDGVSGVNGKNDSEEKIVPDKFMFNIMIEVCAKNEKWDDFARAFLQMLRRGYPFDTRKHLKMVMDSFRAGKVDVLETTWDHMVSFGRTPPVPILMERFCLKLKEGNVVSALSCIRNFDERELRNISSRSWSNLLSNNANRLEERVVEKLVKEIKGILELHENENIVYNNILRGCELFLESRGSCN